MLVFAGATHAADLQAGWYVKLGSVALYGYDSQYGYGVIDWDFVAGVGDYGPFRITQPAPNWPQRLVTVVSDAHGVLPGTGIDLTGAAGAGPPSFVVQSIYFACETYYDATQMQLSLLIRRTTGVEIPLWTQQQSWLYQAGPQLSLGTSLDSGDIFVFRVAVVPEPSALLCLGSAMAALTLGRRWTS